MTFTPASYREGVQSMLDDLPGLTVAAWQHRPESLGFVRAKSADALSEPAIQPHYMAHQKARRVIPGGIRLDRKSVESGKRGSERVDLGGRRILRKKKIKICTTT